MTPVVLFLLLFFMCQGRGLCVCARTRNSMNHSLEKQETFFSSLLALEPLQRRRISRVDFYFLVFETMKERSLSFIVDDLIGVRIQDSNKDRKVNRNRIEKRIFSIAE